METDMEREKESCELCQGSGEIVQRPSRVMGYTLTEGESIDERLVPCPLCKTKGD